MNKLGLILCTVMALSGVALGEDIFSEKPIWSSHTSNSGTDGVARFIDFDRDGDLDFVTAAADPMHWVLYRNEGGKISTEPFWESDETSDLDHLDVIDFNQDGWPDLAGTHETHCTIYLNKQGRFDSTPDWETGLIANANQISFGDYDGDGDLDMVMAAGPPIDGVAIFENTTGLPSKKPTQKLGHEEYSEAAIFVDYDGDGDGKLDIIAHYSGGKTVLYRNTNNEFDEGTVLYDDPENPWTQRHYYYDLDEDGEPELFSAKGAWGRRDGDWFADPRAVSLQLEKQDGTDTLKVRWKSPSGTIIHGFAFHDMDGDGDVDVLASDYSDGGAVHLFLNENGRLADTPVETIQSTGAVHEVVLGDIDLDGDLDLAVGGRDGAHIFENLTITTGFRSAANRVREMINAQFVFQPSVFSGEEFPTADFLNPEEAAGWLGDYDIDVTFYSRDYDVVDAPKEPGRYGAIVKITAEDGVVYTRFRTLYKSPRALNFVFDHVAGELAFPAAAGIDDRTWHNQSRFTNDIIGNALGRDVQRSHDIAILLAGLDETRPQQGPVTQLDSVVTKDRQWWLKLKRELNGNAKRFSKPIVAPVHVDGLNARVLRKGSEKEAGMKRGTVKKINAVLEEWVNNSDQPFNATVARNGVVFFNRAYGSRNGKRITRDTKHVVFSISKALSGSLLMTFVDQGVVSLDMQVGDILPEFDDDWVETPATFHHLFTHTADMDGHFTDLWSDLEQVYGEAYPYLGIGKQHRYNGTSIAIGLKALEQLTGLTLPHLYQKYLFGPLGCESIESIDGSAMTWSNAYDLARVGQMLANHGAYGNLRFFSEETFQQMLPRKLDKLLGPDTKITWGIGLTPYSGNGLSDRTIGHGSASSCTLRVDLEKDLVITMTRQTAGENFRVYHPKFIAAITDGVMD